MTLQFAAEREVPVLLSAGDPEPTISHVNFELLPALCATALRDVMADLLSSTIVSFQGLLAEVMTRFTPDGKMTMML
ncbi:MAG TPA: hypothetical protein VGG21_02645 [Acidimicrobiales bacterium]|jgi:hypothetical protein